MSEENISKKNGDQTCLAGKGTWAVKWRRKDLWTLEMTKL